MCLYCCQSPLFTRIQHRRKPPGAAVPAQLAPTCSRLGPDPAEPPEHPMEGGQEAPGGRSLSAQPPHPQPCRNHSPTEVLVQHTPRRWAVSLPGHPIAPASQLCSPRPLAHPASAATAPEHPGHAAGTELQLPEHGLGNEHKLQPLARRKQKTQLCDAEQRCDQNQAPSLPGHEVQSQQALRSLFLRPIFGVSEHLSSN